MIEDIIIALISLFAGVIPTYLIMKVKKRDTLEIEKRKTIFHEKLYLFKGYLNNLRKLRQKLTKRFAEKEFPSIINAFFNFVNATETNGVSAGVKEILKPFDALTTFSLEIKTEFKEFMDETTTFRLIGTPEMIAILDETEKILDEYYDCLNTYIEGLKKQVEDGSFENVKLELDTVSDIGERLEKKERQLETLMRKELEEI